MSCNRALLLLLLLLGSGCSHTLWLHSSDQINPLNPLVLDSTHNTQELAIKIYQLKSHDKIDKVLTIPWDAFLPGDPPEGLHSFLTVPADTKSDLRPQEDFYVQRMELRRIPIKLEHGTRWLLVVPRGVRAGDRSAMALVQVGCTHKKILLCFDRYDVFQSTSRLWPCQRGEGEL